MSHRVLLSLLFVVCLALAAIAVTAQEPLRALDTGGLETRSAALIFSGQEAGDLALSVLALPLPGAPPPPVDPPEPSRTSRPLPGVPQPTTPEPVPAGKARVALVVDLEGASLLEGFEGEELIGEIYAYAFDEEGGLQDTLTQAFRVDLETHGETLARSGIKFLGHLDLPPGLHSIRLLALHRAAERLALRVLDVHVPNWGYEDLPVLLSPIFPEPPEQWLLVEASEEAGAPAGLPFPMILNGRPVVPATRPLTGSADGTALFLLGRNLPRRLRAHVATEQRESVLELGLGSLEPVTGAPTNMEALAAELNPTDLDGRYLLKIAYDYQQKKNDEPVEFAFWTPIIVLPDELVGDDTFPTWAQLRARSQGGVAVPGLSPEELAARRREKMNRQKLREIYRDALALVAAKHREKGMEAIRILESTEVETGSYKELQRLAESQIWVAEELGKGRSANVLPLIDVHEELYRDYHQNQRFSLSTHSRQMVMRLSETYLKADGSSSQARNLVACALVSLGGYLQEIGAAPSAQKAFEVALEYDERQEAALLSLAVIHESFGHYEEAVEILKRYTKMYPNRPEGRLRLAVNFQRLGSKRKAEPLFRRSLEADNPTWVRILAYQEMARHLASDHQTSAAADLLRKAISKFPDQQRLYVQLASLLDRTGQPREARGVLARLNPRAGRDQDSPRLRYTHMSQRPLLDARRKLSRAADRELAALRDHLSSLTQEGP